MRVATISHSCVIDVNQQIYAELLKHSDVQLLLIAPRQWRSAPRGSVTFAALPDLAPHAIPLRARLAGRIHFHWYPELGPTLTHFRPDIIYVDEEPYSVVTSQALLWRRRLGCKFALCTKQNLLRRYPFPFSAMQARVLAEADHVLVVSQEAAAVVRAMGYQGPVTELPHGIDPALYDPGEGTTDVRSRLGIQGPVIGFVGRIAVEKGVWDLLAAAKVLVQEMGPQFTVLMVGDGPARDKIEDAAERELPPGVFVFTGAVAHHAIPAYLRALDVLVLPSRTRPRWKEQFGRVLVEAMASGVPCVGSDSGHIPELLHGTGGGLVFREGDAKDLARAVLRVLSDPDLAATLARRGREAVLSKYAYPRVAETLYGALAAAVYG